MFVAPKALSPLGPASNFMAAIAGRSPGGITENLLPMIDSEVFPGMFSARVVISASSRLSPEPKSMSQLNRPKPSALSSWDAPLPEIVQSGFGEVEKSRSVKLSSVLK